METTIASLITTERSDRVNLSISAYTLKITYYVIGSVGMFGNFFVLFVILRSKNMRTKVTNMYIINQSTADFMGSFFMVMTSVFEEPNRALDGLADELYCRLWLSKWLLWAMFMTSTYSLIAITIERYISVVHAIWHKTSFNSRKAILSIAMVWLCSLSYIICYMVVPTFINEKCNVFGGYTEIQRKATGILTFVILYLIPIIILVFCYTRMALVLHRRIHPSGPNQQQSNHMSQARTNIIKTLALVSACFILCWTVNQIYFLMFNLGYPANFNGVFYHITVVAIFCNCCINPFIYVAKYESFQRNLKRMLPCWKNDPNSLPPQSVGPNGTVSTNYRSGNSQNPK